MKNKMNINKACRYYLSKDKDFILNLLLFTLISLGFIFLLYKGMFGNFFIKVADVFLNIFDFFKNFNFKNLKLPKRNKTKKEIDPKLFTKLNFSEVKKQKDTQNKLFNKLRKIFLKYFLGKKTIATEILMFLVLFAIAGFEIAGIYLTSIVMIYIFTSINCVIVKKFTN